MRKGRVSVAASASGEGVQRPCLWRRGLGATHAPKTAKPAEPLPVQPGDGVRVGQSSPGIIMVRGCSPHSIRPLCELQHTFDRVRWKVNGDVGQRGNVLRVTDPRSGSACWRLGAVTVPDHGEGGAHHTRSARSASCNIPLTG